MKGNPGSSRSGESVSIPEGFISKRFRILNLTLPDSFVRIIAFFRAPSVRDGSVVVRVEMNPLQLVHRKSLVFSFRIVPRLGEELRMYPTPEIQCLYCIRQTLPETPAPNFEFMQRDEDNEDEFSFNPAEFDLFYDEDTKTVISVPK